MITKKLKAIILDDDARDIKTLDKNLSRNCPEVMVVAHCSFGDEAVNLINECKPDIVFISIPMPAVNGSEFLNKFKNIFFKIIFISHDDRNAIKAVKYGAFDYLLKPVKKEELQVSVSKVLVSTIQESLPVPQNKNPIPYLTFSTFDGISLIHAYNIIYCIGDNAYTTFILADGNNVVISISLKNTTDILEKHNFFRIHQTFLVNHTFIKNYTRLDRSILMSNGDKLPIARRKNNEFLGFMAGLYMHFDDSI